jgi:hypothetical protein
MVYYVRKTKEWILSIDSYYYFYHAGAVRYGGQCCNTEYQSRGQQGDPPDCDNNSYPGLCNLSG